jgi:predicted RNase H-like HicB family nuclease
MSSSLARTTISAMFPAMEVVLTVTQEADGGYVAEGLDYGIFTQGDTRNELWRNVTEAVDAYFFDQPKPDSIRLA